MRLFKLDKYVPSISLLDDVVRAKKAPLLVTGFAAGVLTILFSALMYLQSIKIRRMISILFHTMVALEIAPRPLQGVFMAMPVTIIHLTGDFPIVNYSTWAGSYASSW